MKFKLGVQSLYFLEQIEDESFWFGCPLFAGELVGREPVQSFVTAAEVVGVDEAYETGSDLVMVIVMEAFAYKAPPRLLNLTLYAPLA